MSKQPEVTTGVNIDRVNKVVQLLVAEFGDDITRAKFGDEIWVALQVILGPGEAEHLLNRYLSPAEPRSR